MLDERAVTAAIGSTAYDANGQEIGTVEHFYVDDRTGEPSWVAVTTGLFGTRQSVVPALDATFTEGALRLPVAADAVRNSPPLGGAHLTPDDEAQLRRHYAGGAATPGEPSAAGRHAAGPDDGAMTHDGAMTRSEERLVVGTERIPTTRARLVKYVVTEEVQITVPVRREEVRLEQVPIDAPADPGRGESLVAEGPSAPGTPAGLPEEVVLHAERPVVTVEVEAIERVRIRTEVVPGQETVTGQVQRERITVDEDPGPRRT
ncbi:DUF2382 domain-containing protein [Blastococcus tunisiensis]|uniref:PRC-barrel domain-containing protein n=1 Tax=Blastococcus tunisiensis TaxID=1798228 RepID=A0A1I2FII3_9ACTN|nr:PRC and DUF2382 domain-containing protein [Blastococcus sp. DSM 46838]SFF05075.1 PRC-barrel domain-containing protein [Blastococcus sp. DSM 46838]